MIPLWFKLAYTTFVAVLIPVYTVEHGLVNFLWLSNVALLGGLVAAWLENRRLTSMLLVAVLLMEAGWILDFLLSLLLGGVAPFGIAQYMYDPEILLLARLLSLYHLPLPFVLLWMAWRLGYDRHAFRYWLPAGLGILLLTYLLVTPDQNVNWVMGPFGEPQEWVHPVAWLGFVMIGSTLVWALTHVLARTAFARFGRVSP